MRIRSQINHGTVVLLRLPADGRSLEAETEEAGERSSTLRDSAMRAPVPEGFQGLRAVG
jgi:lambda repressor-like predicted transcriptional regulator